MVWKKSGKSFEFSRPEFVGILLITTTQAYYDPAETSRKIGPMSQECYS